MNIIETKIHGLLIIEPKVFSDERGWFMESYSRIKFDSLNINCEFIQDNHSFSAHKGTIRGLHFQLNPKAQTKLIRCTSGVILDVAVDLRKNSANYKKWIAVELSAENKKQLLIPRGFAHGFLTLSDNVEVQYKTDQYYSPECDGGIIYNDPEIGIKWGEGAFILSEKDQKAPLLKDRTDLNF